MIFRRTRDGRFAGTYDCGPPRMSKKVKQRDLTPQNDLCGNNEPVGLFVQSARADVISEKNLFFFTILSLDNPKLKWWAHGVQCCKVCARVRFIVWLLGIKPPSSCNKVSGILGCRHRPIFLVIPPLSCLAKPGLYVKVTEGRQFLSVECPGKKNIISC